MAALLPMWAAPGFSKMATIAQFLRIGVILWEDARLSLGLLGFIWNQLLIWVAWLAQVTIFRFVFVKPMMMATLNLSQAGS
jgi:hypothetical protein